VNPLKIADLVPEVGIWWYWNGKILAYREPWTAVVDDGGFLCTEVEHIKHWRFIQDVYPELKSYKYDDFPRGRVWYRKSDNRFSITCSEEFSKDRVGLKAVRDNFDLNNRRFQIVVDKQYVR
jgi:hypothetical protein